MSHPSEQNTKHIRKNASTIFLDLHTLSTSDQRTASKQKQRYRQQDTFQAKPAKTTQNARTQQRGHAHTHTSRKKEKQKKQKSGVPRLRKLRGSCCVALNYMDPTTRWTYNTASGTNGAAAFVFNTSSRPQKTFRTNIQKQPPAPNHSSHLFQVPPHTIQNAPKTHKQVTLSKAFITPPDTHLKIESRLEAREASQVLL